MQSHATSNSSADAASKARNVAGLNGSQQAKPASDSADNLGALVNNNNDLQVSPALTDAGHAPSPSASPAPDTASQTSSTPELRRRSKSKRHPQCFEPRMLPNNRGTTSQPLPQTLTPRMQKAIRLFASGVTATDACAETKVGLRYFTRIMKWPIGRTYYNEVSRRIETAHVDKAAAVAAGQKQATQTQSIIQTEIDESVLESVQELRQILKSSRSDNARALAAKELLDLAQAKRRYMAALADKDSEIALSEDDVRLFSQTIADLRTMHAEIKWAESNQAAPEPSNRDASIIRAVELASDTAASSPDIADIAASDIVADDIQEDSGAANVANVYDADAGNEESTAKPGLPPTPANVSRVATAPLEAQVDEVQ